MSGFPGAWISAANAPPETAEISQLDRWYPAAPVFSDANSACAYDRRQTPVQNVMAILACERPERYGRDLNGQTYCNAYATQVLNAIFPSDIALLTSTLPPNQSSILADTFYAYFTAHWPAIPATMPSGDRIVLAQRYADAGYLVVASEPGHIGFVQPSWIAINQLDTGDIVLSQGGATAGQDIPLAEAWRASALESTVTFFYKLPGS